MVVVEKRRVEREWWETNGHPLGRFQLNKNTISVELKNGNWSSIDARSWPAIRAAIDALYKVWLEMQEEAT